MNTALPHDGVNRSKRAPGIWVYLCPPPVSLNTSGTNISFHYSKAVFV